MADEMDKNHDATPFKLMEARRKGQVARSSELPTFFSLLAMLATLIAMLGASAALVATKTAWWLESAHAQANDMSYLWNSLIAYVSDLVRIVLSIVIAGLLATVVATFVHVGPVFSGFPMKPDFTRLNPAKGFKKVFSRRSLVDLVRLIAKVIAFCWVAYVILDYKKVTFLTPNHASAYYVLANWKDIFQSVAYAALGVFLVFAVFDIWFSKGEFARQMKMSSRDVKDESKRREGDPEIKAKRKRILAELLKNASSVRNVKDSDVVITNPTHVAIALQYRPDTMAVPIVIAKGGGFLAANIRQQARRHGIPIIRKPALARALLKQVNLSHPIPEDLQMSVAGIYKWVVSMPNNRVFNR